MRFNQKPETGFSRERPRSVTGVASRDGIPGRVPANI
jgi:hypothetical protein